MSVYQELINLNKIFSQLKEPPVIINDVMNTSEEERENLKNSIYTRYNTDLLSNLPRCECGDLKGEYCIGIVCENCHTEVISVMDTDIEPILWMRSPRGVAPLINPIVWTMLNEFFTSSNFEILMWICDTTYRPQIKIPKALDDVQMAGIQRGYNYFVQNFDAILDLLFNLKSFKSKRQKAVYLRELIALNRDCIFTDYIPLPNKSLLLIEDTNHGVYVDPIVVGAIDAIETIACIDSSLSEHSIRTKENKTIRALSKLADFNDSFRKLSLSKKSGIYRKHMFGSRSHFSFRAVISSITDAHQYDEIYIPWGVATSVFRIKLLNKLFKRGWTQNQAIGFINAHAQKYHPLLDELFKELIAEAKDGRISSVTQRN